MADVERDENGRFLPGHAIKSPGRPPVRLERAYMDNLRERLTLDKWIKIINRAITDAIKGDRYAREWLSNYAIGRPPYNLQISASDAATLKEILMLLDTQNIPAGDLFAALLEEIAASSQEVVTYESE
jgi:hypothetical protein